MLWLLDKLIGFILYLFLFVSLITTIITYGHDPSAATKITVEASVVVFVTICLVIRAIILQRVRLTRPETIGLWLGLFASSAIGLFGVTPLMLWMIDGTPPLDTMMKVLQAMVPAQR